MSGELNVKVIYEGSHTQKLGVVMDDDHPSFGWLVYEHPDGQWVTLCSLFHVANEISSEENQRSINRALMSFSREADDQKMLRLGGLEILVQDGVISSGRARELGGYTIEQQRAYIRNALLNAPPEEPEL